VIAKVKFARSAPKNRPHPNLLPSGEGTISLFLVRRERRTPLSGGSEGKGERHGRGSVVRFSNSYNHLKAVRNFFVVP
jgi:hypothetical protein